jgi:hypothetical protein
VTNIILEEKRPQSWNVVEESLVKEINSIVVHVECNKISSLSEQICGNSLNDVKADIEILKIWKDLEPSIVQCSELIELQV